jgi:hypothetical protein
MLQAFHLELRYASRKRKQKQKKEKAERRKNRVRERNDTSAPSDMETSGISEQTNCQHDETEEVSDQVHNKSGKDCFWI